MKAKDGFRYGQQVTFRNGARGIVLGRPRNVSGKYPVGCNDVVKKDAEDG